MRELFDRVRNLYGYATAYNSDPNLKHLQKLRDHNLAEFDRMIAQVRKEAKAEALRDAANSGLFVGPIADMLEARADQMEGDV